MPSSSPIAPPLSLTKRFVIAAASAVNDAACRSDGTINRRLVSLLDPSIPPSAKPHHGVRTADVPVDPSRDVWFRLFVPATEPASRRRIPAIVFFHGGGFAFMSPASYMYDDLCRRICRTVNAVVISVNYRPVPEHRYPAQYDDGIDVLHFLEAGGLLYADPPAAELADLSNCFLVGDSAGGNIVHHVARRWATDAVRAWKRVRLAGMERTEAELRLAGAPLVSVERTDWLWRALLPEGADRDHEASNVFGPKARQLEEALPAALVVVGSFDPLQDWQRRYYKGLRARGKVALLVEYPEAIHAFYAFPDLKESAALMEEIKSFVDSHR
ncbi:putative carboxylesterase 18 [Canna indica]|uniref:Carboxylesterase 18 n=1 Tax=Canna indica TaxID=4628 RepID=A0AAQ3QN86_9LILI|nr:putative carboxylesterase 18 [Canna indica]